MVSEARLVPTQDRLPINEEMFDQKLSLGCHEVIVLMEVMFQNIIPNENIWPQNLKKATFP